MLMRFYLSLSVGHMCMHNLQHPVASGAPEINREYEDNNVIYILDQGQEGSSGSELDLESTDSGNNAMDTDKDVDSMSVSE